MNIELLNVRIFITNTLGYVQVVLSGTIWAFFAPVWVVSNAISPTVSTQIFRVWVSQKT